VSIIESVPRDSSEPSPYAAAIASAVRRLVAECGGQEEAAAKLRLHGASAGCDQATVSRMMRGKTEPRLRTLVALASALGVSLEELMGLRPSAAASPPPAVQPHDLAQAIADRILTALGAEPPRATQPPPSSGERPSKPIKTGNR
jgi:transcriptional regulator with XRE-family HTH domain